MPPLHPPRGRHRKPADTTVLVTGASTGLGLAIGRALIARGYRVVLTARPESMHRFADLGIREGQGVFLRALDVRDPDHRLRIITELEVDLGGIDVLVNNAGISYRTVIEHATERDLQDQLLVNFQAPMELARLSLAGMRARRWGRIIHVSSVGGMMAMPTMGLYSASKHALEGASEALWYEVRPWGIGVTLVEPGFINSDGFQKVRYTPLAQQAEADQRDPYHAHYRYMADFIGAVMRRVQATPQSVANKVVRVIEHPDPPLRVPATLDASLFFWLRRMLPRWVYHRVLYWGLPSVRKWGRGPFSRPALPETGPKEDAED
ncbi:MAG: SDR family NAD(P)-dependent oxidoreductase [Oligoflexia bacterium]|nr:SDR family NAD(P)-dependent oxidoreductase [Oligoflexia bacterium]